jgi:hypothetical protein
MSVFVWFFVTMLNVIPGKMLAVHVLRPAEGGRGGVVIMRDHLAQHATQRGGCAK